MVVQPVSQLVALLARLRGVVVAQHKLAPFPALVLAENRIFGELYNERTHARR
jgi:hypothetical protein